MDPAARERLLETMLVELEGSGRDRIPLAGILADTGVSESDFATEYGDVDGCLDAAYQQLVARLDSAVRRGCRITRVQSQTEGGEWPAGVWGGLDALLAELSRRPELARALTRTFPALGPRQKARYQAFVESFGPMLEEGRELSGVAEDLPAEVEMLAVGGAEAIVSEEIASGRAEELRAIGPSVLFSLLVPFLGPTRAAVAMESAPAGSGPLG